MILKLKGISKHKLVILIYLALNQRIFLDYSTETWNPIKTKDTLIDSKLPEIRVNVTYDAIVGQNKIYHGLGINISNHSKETVFLKYPKISLINQNEHIPIFKNDIYGTFISEIRLESGDSYYVFTNPDNYINFINELDKVIVDDKIGRVFKGNPDELNKAVNNWNKSR